MTGLAIFGIVVLCIIALVIMALLIMVLPDYMKYLYLLKISSGRPGAH